MSEAKVLTLPHRVTFELDKLCAQVGEALADMERRGASFACAVTDATPAAHERMLAEMENTRDGRARLYAEQFKVLFLKPGA